VVERFPPFGDDFLPVSNAPAAPSPRRGPRFVIVLLAVALAVVAIVFALRLQADAALQETAQARARPAVALAAGDPSSGRSLSLAGRLEAVDQAELHARTDGYLKRRFVDIGQPVRKGQVLAEIDTPDLDQQVLQAVAQLDAARANEAVARSASQRAQTLAKQGFVSSQASEEKAGELLARSGATKAAAADLARLRALQAFKQVVAPFDGTVVARNADVGALVSGGGSDKALFMVADARRLRIYVNVPQGYADALGAGAEAEVRVPEYPGEVFKAQFARQSGVVDPASGTMLAELLLDNPGGRLKPGGFADVSFEAVGHAGEVTVPATALLFRASGPVVLVLSDRKERVAVRSVSIQRDLGAAVVIGSGLKPGEPVIDNPPEELQTGDLVRVVARREPGSAGK
jgi:RND family efflux transporter MFP subunit